MEYAIEVLERDLRNCKNAKIIDDKYPDTKRRKNWEDQIKQLEAAIAKLMG